MFFPLLPHMPRPGLIFYNYCVLSDHRAPSNMELFAKAPCTTPNIAKLSNILYAVSRPSCLTYCHCGDPSQLQVACIATAIMCLRLHAYLHEQPEKELGAYCWL